jgi:hypothetical protein
MAVKIRIKRGTTAQWNASTTALTPGELGYDLETKVIKIGDGTTLWNNLDPLNKFEVGEIAQDAIYSALTDFVSVGPNITVTYDDPENIIILDVGPNVVLQDNLTNAISALSSVYEPVGSVAGALAAANEYTDIAISGLGNQIGEDYIPISLLGNPDGVAQLDENGFIPDSQIPSGIARDSELFSGSYNDLTDKPTIALGAVQWTANHYQLEGGANTRYLAGDIVWDGGNIYVANFDNESLPTTNATYWSLVGPGNRLNIDGRDIPNIIWNNILDKPNIFSGSYNDLTDKPTLFDGDYNNLINLPTLFDGNYSSLIGSPAIPSDINDLTDNSNLLIPSVSPSFTGTMLVEDIEISGDLTFTGTATQINSTVTVLSDPMIYLGDGNISNLDDLGFVASFTDGIYQHTGLVRDASDNKWKLFKGVVDEPTSTVNFSQAVLDILAAATFEGNLVGNVTGDVSGNAGTVTDGVYTSGTYTDPSWLTLSKSKVGLDNVDNTSDADKPISTATEAALSTKADNISSYVTDSATSRTVQSSDINKVIEFTSSSTITVTVPNDASDSLFPIGSSMEYRQMGTGRVEFVITLPATLVSPDNYTKTRTRYSSVLLEKRASNAWILVGDLDA